MSGCLIGTPVNESYFLTNPVVNYSHRSRRNAGGFSSAEAIELLQRCKKFNHIKLIHSKIIKTGLIYDQLLVRKLLALCFSFGKTDYANCVFDQVNQPLTYTWNLMIREYSLHGFSYQAILLYNRMISLGFQPDKFTFPFVIKACLGCSALDKGKEVHGQAIKAGLYNDTFVRNTLMDLYFKFGDLDSGCSLFETTRVRTIVSWTTFVAGLIACGQLDAAYQAFNRMPERNVVSWTAIINGCVKHQRPQEAFDLFSRMQLENVRPNEYTVVSLLKACSQLGSLSLGSWIHDCALKSGFKLGPFLGSALIDMYSKCGSLDSARQVYENIQSKTLVCWNTMITSLGVHGCADEALVLFAQMEIQQVRPDAITFVGVLCACVSKNDVNEGERLFKRMTNWYRIKPTKEHYDCLAELYSRAYQMDKIPEPGNGSPSKVNALSWATATHPYNVAPHGAE